MFISSVVSTVGRRIMRGQGYRVTSSLFSMLSSNPLIGYWEGRDGEHAYLEEVMGKRALSWVEGSNSDCLQALGDPKEHPLYSEVLAILESKDKIAHVSKIGEHYYNFWLDENNTRGLWRRTTWESYMSKTGNVEWETVLDIDALGKQEGESWVYKGVTTCNLSDDETPTRTLLRLSRGGSDATVVREFDLVTKKFVPESEGGFVMPEAKSRASWLTKDTLLVGTNFKDGDTLTDSGYPRTVHEWKRGTPLDSAPKIFEGEKTDVSTAGYVTRHGKHSFEWRARSLTFYTNCYSLRKQGTAVWHDLSTTLQDDAEVSHFADQLLIELRSDWLEYRAGSLLAVDMEDFVANGTKAKFTVIFKPSAKVSLLSYTVLKTRLAIHVLENVKSRISFLRYDATQAGWIREGEEPEAVIRGASLRAVDCHGSDKYWLSYSSFLTPSCLSVGDATDGVKGIEMALKSPIKSLKAQYNATGLEETQAEAVSADGTVVPYFIVRRKGVATPQPTLLFGYGGFEISLTPSYMAVTGKAWLESGGVFVYANIRGGGEFGPRWHQSALKENRNKAYEDFIAISENLITTGVCTSKQLGIRGGSNGGLLMGNMLVQRPDLFGAVCCAVPLLDMKRYSHLLAGASWMAEYGNPDTSDWSFLKKYSAYHNIARDASHYPPMLMTTSTKDDRVHPYHARSFVKRLRDVGHRDLHYYENIEGGHGGAADFKQSAFMTVLYINFMKKTLGLNDLSRKI